jgi:hypothetical protein
VDDFTWVETGKFVTQMKRAEKLAKRDLNHLRRDWKCSKCSKTHEEWFEVDEETAKEVTKRWTEWINKQAPYEFNNHTPNDEHWRLKPIWAWLMDERRVPRASFGHDDHQARWNHWDRLLLPPSSNTGRAWVEYSKKADLETPNQQRDREELYLPYRQPEHYGWSKEHIVLGPTDEEPLSTCKFLGKGSIGSVEEVRCRNTQLPTFVRKRVELSPRKRQAQAEWELIRAEAKCLKSLIHDHIVTLIGSYDQHTESPTRHTYFFLMCPVGDNDLKHFLDEVGEHFEQNAASAQLSTWKGWIASWFVCLSSALAYMHKQGVRHQDIKPSNIIHKGGQIYFTDFRSADTFEAGHTTSTEKQSHTSPMYAAPEIIAKYERHGRGSDIFALGGVFCDMLTVIEDQSVESF